ncbi:MAG: hypothetical protein INR71_04420 [Terriglobus roseus]|nr:hypothetical protein [Terriglobus roseus]
MRLASSACCEITRPEVRVETLAKGLAGLRRARDEQSWAWVLVLDGGNKRRDARVQELSSLVRTGVHREQEFGEGGLKIALDQSSLRSEAFSADGPVRPHARKLGASSC